MAPASRVPLSTFWLTCSHTVCYPKPIYQLGWCQLHDRSNRRKHRRNFHESHLVGVVSLWQPWVLPSSKAWILFLLSGQTQMEWAQEAYPGDGRISDKRMKKGRSRNESIRKGEKSLHIPAVTHHGTCMQARTLDRYPVELVRADRSNIWKVCWAN